MKKEISLAFGRLDGIEKQLQEQGFELKQGAPIEIYDTAIKAMNIFLVNGFMTSLEFESISKRLIDDIENNVKFL